MARRGPNRRALEETLARVDLSPVMAQLLRSLADAVDAQPSKAALWREYRAALAEALAGREDDGEAALAELRSVAALGDAADGQAE